MSWLINYFGEDFKLLLNNPAYRGLRRPRTFSSGLCVCVCVGGCAWKADEALHTKNLELWVGQFWGQ